MATRDVGTTQRPPSTALLTIDSEDRFANWVEKRLASINPTARNVSPYDFSLIRNASLINGYMTRLAVSEVVFPWTYPNINNNTNLIKITVVESFGDPVEALILLDTGFYTPAALAAQITTKIQEHTTFFLMTYGQDNLPRFSYSMSGGIGNTISFEPLVYGVTYTDGPVNIIWDKPDTVKQLFDVLGFTNLNNLPENAATGEMSLAQAVRYIDIVSPQLTANQGLPDATSQPVGNSALCRLYLGDGYTPTQGIPVSDPKFSPPGCAPFVIYRQFAAPKQIHWNTIRPVSGRIQFQVLDDNGEILPAAFGFAAGETPATQVVINYTDWSLTLLLTEN